MKCLVVIDMQEDYVGECRNKKRFSYDTQKLINNINKRISSYPTHYVVYITNKFFWEFNKSPKKLVEGLDVVSDNIFEKRKNSAFTNSNFVEYLKKHDVHAIEVVGVDGNYCVGFSALDGCKKDFSVILNELCVGVSNKKKFEKVKEVLVKKGVKII